MSDTSVSTSSSQPSVMMIANAAAIHTVRWANAIAARGWKVHLVTLSPFREPLDERITVHRARWEPPGGYLLAAPFVRRLARSIRPSLVHAHYVGGYGLLAAVANIHPLVMSVWGSDVYEFPAKSPLHAFVTRRILGRADLVLSISEVMARHTRQYVDGKIGITPWGVDTTTFRARPAHGLFAPSDIVIGTIKTLHPKYGIEYLIRAFAILRQRHPDLPLKLLIVGEGPLEQSLKRLAAELGVAERTRFTGRIEHALVPEYQNMLSVSVSVSVTDSESFGVAVVEASACERPVVVSSVGGLPEVVEDGVTGLVVPPRDPARTADAIERLVLADDLRRRMGVAGRRRVMALYDWERNVDTMIGFYTTLVGDRDGPAVPEARPTLPPDEGPLSGS